MHRYYIIYKPFQVLSQFTSTENKKSLKDFFKVPSDVYPVGRLDYDSEGLLILTNDKKLNYQLLSPDQKHQREYWVQVEGSAATADIMKLKKGVSINVNGSNYQTEPCEARIFEVEPLVPKRTPPIRYRKNIPTSWISVVLTEGKNRQVRKMTAAAGLPTLRLIRHRINGIALGAMQPGDIREMEKKSLYALLFHQG